MKLSREHVEALAKTVGLDLPEDEIPHVVRQLAALLEAMQDAEDRIGHLLDAVEPIPPVFPHEDS
jgi:Asp-tRNA(Asn)/Glu-tRNA(Gln) amidotransferase C subunit